MALASLAAYLDHSPLVLDHDAKRSDGITITRKAESDVLVVLDYQAIADNSGPGFGQRDFSVAWINLFEQEIGPVSIATPTSLSMSLLDGARVVVLTASVADQIPQALLEQLRQHALDGNTIVVERPDGALRETFSANGRAGVRTGQSISFARGLAKPYNAQLLEMPLSTQYVGSTSPRDGATTLMSIDGAPAIYATPIGEGYAITVDFDIGQQLVALQQGRPTDDFRVVGADAAATPRTTDLIMDPGLAANAVPYADLLERFIVYGVIGAYTPLPTFWPFPGGADGALIAVHSDAELGDGAGWMLDYEIDHHGVSTLLSTVDAGLSASGAAVIERKGGELGLAWKKAGTPLQIDRATGIGEFQPVAQSVGLDDQLDTLRQTLPSNYVRTARIADSWWDRQWSRPFELMAAQDLRIDTSYNPAPGAGYAFGTGFPFLVVDDAGQPLGIRELPVVYPAGVSGGPELAKLIEQSSRGHHEAIGWSVAPTAFADYPDMTRFEAWLSVFELAQRHDHIITSVARFDRFLRLRRAGRIQTRVVAQARLPRPGALAEPDGSADSDTDEPAEPPDSAGRARLLRITVEAKRADMSLAVPAAVAGKEFQRATRGGRRMGGRVVSGDVDTVGANLVGYRIRRIPLDAGFNTIAVYYQ